MKTVRLSILFIFILLLSCGKPPVNLEVVNFIDLIKKNIDILNEGKNNQENFLKYFKEIINNFNAIIIFDKDSTISIDSNVASPEDNDIICSIENNKFIVNKPFYITLKGKDPAYSIDNKTWYSVKNNLNNSIEGIKYKYDIESFINDKNILIKYKLNIQAGQNPIVLTIDKNKEVMTLKKGMIFSSSLKRENRLDLSKSILFIPKGTVLFGFHIINGDLIVSEYLNGKIVIKALQTIYFYKKDFSTLMISLDKKKWFSNILTTEIKPDIEMYAKEDKEIFFNISTTLNHDSTKLSTFSSIFKIILMKLK